MFSRLSQSFRRFMYGRYGADQLNMTLLIAAVVISLISGILSWFLGDYFVYSAILWPLLNVLMWVLMGLAIFRMLSRNVYKRQRENMKFRNFWLRLTDRSNRYFRCPACKQTVRVPRRRGKISIRCPKCGEKFIRKT